MQAFVGRVLFALIFLSSALNKCVRRAPGSCASLTRSASPHRLQTVRWHAWAPATRHAASCAFVCRRSLSAVASFLLRF